MSPSPTFADCSPSSLRSAKAGVFGRAIQVGHSGRAIPTGVAGRAKIPWEIASGAAAVTCAIVGLEWDIAWHSSIGRDTFWTPAHMAIYLCGLLTGVICAYLVLVTTFGSSQQMRVHAVRIFGFHAPLGAFVATWGGLAMLVSASFDNWWHSAYGLDVEVLSPPHLLLFLGLAMIAFGFLLLTMGAMNRAAAAGDDGLHRKLRALFLYVGGLNLMMYMIILEQRSELWLLHNTMPYKSLAITVPFLMALLSQASRARWAATSAALVYSVIRILAILILPLVPATPKLGPVFTPVTHLVPANFPILLVVPAFALDLLWQHTEGIKLWLRSVLSGLLFVATLVGAEWPFADFLISRGAANRFFGAMYVGYATRIADRAPHLGRVQSGLPLWHGLFVATVSAVCVGWIGLKAGRWMQMVER